MARKKSINTKDRREKLLIDLYFLFRELRPEDFAEILGLPRRTFFYKLAKVRKEKGELK